MRKKTDFIAKLSETKNVLDSSRKNVMSRFFVFKKISTEKILINIVVVLSILFFIIFALLIYQNIYSHRFYIGVKAGNTNMGGQTFLEAKNQMIEKMDSISNDGLIIIYQNKKVIVPAAVIGDTPDLSFDIFHFDAENTLTRAFRIGRSNDVLKNSFDQISAIFLKPNLAVDYNIDEEKIISILQNNFSEFEKPAKDAEIIFDNNQATVKGEAHGKIFDYENIIEQIKKRLAYLDEKSISISLKTDYPLVYEEEAKPLLDSAKNALNLAPIKLITPSDYKSISKTEWIINKEQLSNLLTVKKNIFQYDKGWFSAPELKEEFYIGLKQEELEKYFEEEIIKFADINPINAKFKVENGKVTEFEASENGQKLNIEETFQNLEKIIKQNSVTEKSEKIIVEIVIEEAKSKINNENVNDLGIKDLISTGHSNFAGSSWSRRHNISTGALSAHGTLVKPGEEFSMNETLGEVNAVTNYLPEMVIKGNETIPEYGGGLCQVGTTMFRAALEAGFPISERRNHSYRVRYYEPAGTDATIYGPHPDLRFINDTKNYILIQRRIDGNILYFDIWGTNDGRIASTTYPIIYNITAPPPTKTIETEELEPGKKKCTEHAIYGADAYFDYTVTYPNGDIKETRFTSHYRPWREVCLVGVEKTSSSTPKILENN